MNRILVLIALAATTMAIAAAQPSTVTTDSPSAPGAICDDISAHIGPIHELTEVLFGYPLEQLAKSQPPLLELAGRMGRPDKQIMEKMFHPTPELNEIFGRYTDSMDFAQVLGFPNSNFHAIWSEGGSDHCMTFEFFDAPKAEKARRLPPLPAWVDANGEGLCRPHAGYLVRWRGRVGFLLRDEGTDFSVALRYIPFEQGAWREGCRINVAVPTIYAPVKVSIAKHEPINRAELESVLPKTIEAKLLADRDQKIFSYSNTAQPPLKLEAHPFVEIFQKPGADFDLPLFGTDEPTAIRYRLSKDDTKLASVRLNGRPYLMRSGFALPFAGMKWPVILVILYRIDNENGVIVLDEKTGRGVPVASAVLEMRPGNPTTTVGLIK